MTTKIATTTLRRCIGSARFAIEPHDAPLAEFPKQPSQKDGLGRMCATHWKAYVKGLNAERKAGPARPSRPRARSATTRPNTRPPTRSRRPSRPGGRRPGP